MTKHGAGLTFRLGEVAGWTSRKRVKQRKTFEPPVDGVCPTGKVGYRTKDAVKTVLKAVNYRTAGRPLQPYRCDWCHFFHIGHRRGVVL